MNRDKLISVAKGAGLAAGGAALTYLGHWALGSDLGPYGPLLGAFCATAINVLRKWLQDESAPPPPAPPAQALRVI